MYDVIVVGGGPAGLSAAQTLGRSRRDVLLLADGQPRNVTAPGVHQLISRDGVAPTELLKIATEELSAYQSVELRSDAAAAASGSAGQFTVELARGGSASAKRLILATGVVDELPDLPGLAASWGDAVSHCPYCHGWELRDRAAAVIALSPLDAYFAALLTQWTHDVVLCTHGVQLADDQRMVLELAGVAVREDVVTEIIGRGSTVEELRFADGEPLARECVFVHAPTRQRSQLPGRLGCRLLDDGCVAVDELGQTSVEGVFAVGDMARREASIPGMTHVARSMSDGVIAAQVVNQTLFFSSLGFG